MIARNLALVSSAILLPTVIFASVFFAYAASADQKSARQQAIALAQDINRDVDRQTARISISMRIFATSAHLRQRDWAGARDRAAQIARLNPDWVSVSLWDLTSGSTLFSTVDSAVPLRPSDFRRPLVPDQVVFDGIRRRDGRCTCLLVAQQLTGPLDGHALVVEVDPKMIQANLKEGTPPDAVSAVVDRDGNFIGRSINFEERVGLPATQYVRGAIRKGTHGFYEGRTYEGLHNYTAFATSPVTGWSSHMAVSSALISGPQRQRIAALTIAAFVSLVVAAMLLYSLLRAQATKRAADLRIAESQRMESLGKLTGGIAHDFNNMLTIITGGIELALRKSPDDPDVRRYLNAAKDGAGRANDLTKRMLAYARRQRLKPTVLDPRDMLRDIVVLLDRTLGDDVQIDCTVDDDVWLIEVDRSELENAIVNLATNARDAMPDGGRIQLTASNAEGHRPSLIKGVPTDCLKICVTDTGEGIPESEIAKVTEPFYTTKQTGRGTGLGLSQVAGFVRQSGGDIAITSEVGLGTTVCLLLPRYVGEMTKTIAPSASAEATAKRLSIMLVEDDDGVRDATANCLAELGHSVAAFEGGEAALEALGNARINLVITDYQMPGMSGEALANAVRERRPDLPVLMISAYQRDGDHIAGIPLLAKPFSLDELARAIANVVGAARTA